MPTETLTVGTAYNFNASSWTCDVQPDGALTAFLHGVPVSRQIMPSLLPNGARVALVVFDDNNPADAMVVGVTTTNLRLPSCRVYRNAAQSIPTGVQTLISFTTLRHDTMSAINPMWSLATPTDVIVRTPGIYLVNAGVEFATNASGERTVALFDVTANQFIAIDERAPVASDTTDVTVSGGPYLVAAATSFQLYVFQNSGAPLNVDAISAYSPELSVAMIG